MWNILYSLMEVISIEDLLGDSPILKENEFRETLSKHPWDSYEDKPVLIKGCSQKIIPVWAYLLICSHLQPFARKIFFGDRKSPIPIYKKT